MTHAPAKFEVATSNGLGDVFMSKNIICSLTLTLKVTQNVAQYPLHHVTHVPATFEVAIFKDLKKDTITRNVTDGQTDYGPTGTKLIYPMFLICRLNMLIYEGRSF